MPSVARIPRPNSNEHISYYGKYVELVPDGDFVAQLGSEIGNTAARLRRTPADREDFAYPPGKWTVKEAVGGMADVARVMGVRALWFARADAAPLPGFDENAWVPSGNFAKRSLADLTAELEAVRGATIAFVRGLDESVLTRRGVA